LQTQRNVSAVKWFLRKLEMTRGRSKRFERLHVVERNGRTLEGSFRRSSGRDTTQLLQVLICLTLAKASIWAANLIQPSRYRYRYG
jgi:hypothetical protein